MKPEVPGVGNLQVAAVGQGVGDLAAEVRRQHHVVGEADDQRRGRDASVSRQPVALGRDRRAGCAARASAWSATW